MYFMAIVYSLAFQFTDVKDIRKEDEEKYYSFIIEVGFNMFFLYGHFIKNKQEIGLYSFDKKQ